MLVDQHANDKGIIHCVDATTPIVVSDGTSCPIQDLCVGQRVISWNEETEKFEQQEIEAVINNGARDCVELTFDNGKTLVCTPDHKLLTRNRGWVEALELTQDDELLDTMNNTYMNAITRSP